MYLSEIYNSYESLLVHSTKFQGGAMGCLDAKASVVERITKAINTKTTISCSSICMGNAKTFGPIGLILKTGLTTAAGFGDLGSTLEGFDRVCEDQGISISHQVDNAIIRKQGYNEFLIKNHSYLGIYISHDNINYSSQEVGGFEKFWNETNKFDLPYFIFEYERIWEAEFDQRKKCFAPKNEVTVSDLKKKYRLDFKKQQLKDEIVKKGSLESFKYIVEELVIEILDSGCLLSCDDRREVSYIEQPKDGANHIRLGTKKNLVPSTYLIWDMLHEYGHHLDGKKKESDEKEKREKSAWERAEEVLMNFPDLLSLKSDFNTRKTECLKSHGIMI